MKTDHQQRSVHRTERNGRKRMNWHDELKALGPCKEAFEWAQLYPTLEEAWQACKRGDRMLWLMARADHRADHRTLVTIAVECARLAWPHAGPATRTCIEVVEAWLRGEATIGQVRAAIASATASATAIASATAASYASDDAIAAAIAAAKAAAASDAAADAADAAAFVAASDAEVHEQCADIVRRHCPVPPTFKKREVLV